MNKTKFKLIGRYVLLTALTGLTILGCKKGNSENLPDEIANTSNERLSLTKKAFNGLYSELKKTNGKELPANFLSRFPEFVSLLHHDSKLASKTALSIKPNSPLMVARKAALKASLGPVAKTSVMQNSAYEETAPTYDEVMTELVDDQAFKSLLNVEGEIQVDDIVYKVTPYGTFFTTASNYNSLNSVFADIALQNDYTLRLEDQAAPILMNSVQVQSTQYNDVRLLNSNVFFVDSFIEEDVPQPEVTVFPSDETLAPLVYPNINDGGNNNGNNITPPPPSDELPIPNRQSYILNTQMAANTSNYDPAYSNTIDYPIEFRTGFGSILQTFFDNSTRYNNFTNKYRMSALFYNRNYGIIKTLGIKVKCQKKGWLWWNKTEAQEIRAGWDYISYKSDRSVDKIGLPSNKFAPSIGEPYLINPTEDPFYGVPMWSSTDTYAKRYNLYGWYMKRGNNEIFTITIPGGILPINNLEDVDLPSSVFKGIVQSGWNKLKGVLEKSAPSAGPSLYNPNASNYKFPVYPLNGYGEVKYLSINDMENMPKSFMKGISKTQFLNGDYKVYSIVSPQEIREYNTDMIDIPLEFSTVDINLSTNVNNLALDIGQAARSLVSDQLGKHYEVDKGTIIGAVKWDNQWRSIRLNFKMKD
ncbi:hypothetical protein CA265_05720 [Sphingobacteriaceae bacterium GW460-11-11-14-LB5]|nr:hypothetical protein CA265_05720 [Sphingobacteriaceae bacterium GW460-11-11-14-LB5]